MAAMISVFMMMPMVVVASVVTMISVISVVSVTWAGNCPVPVNRTSVAIPNKSFFRVNRTTVTVATHINGSGGCMIPTTSMMGTGFNINSSSNKSKCADGNGGK